MTSAAEKETSGSGSMYGGNPVDPMGDLGKTLGLNMPGGRRRRRKSSKKKSKKTKRKHTKKSRRSRR